MVKTITSALFFILLGAMLMYYGLSRHFIQAEEELVVLPKSNLALQDTWVDIREWTPKDFKEHQAVTKALLEHDREDLVIESFPGVEQAQGVLDALKDLGTKVIESAKDVTKPTPEQ